MDSIGGLSFLASLAYLVTTALALAAAWLGAGRPRASAVLRWVLVGGAFVVLAAWRFYEGEAVLQERVRSWTRVKGLYDDRYSFQVPVTLVAIVVVAVLVWLALRRRGPGHSGQALAVTTIMLIFTAVRAASLHAVDAVLYQSIGPVHINYLIDLGLTAIVALLAIMDCLPGAAPQQKPTRRRRRSRRSRPGADR